MIVVDASVVVAAFTDRGAGGAAAREVLRREASGLNAPELLDVEVVSALRRLETAGYLDPLGARSSLDDLAGLDVQRHRHTALLSRAWQLRRNITSYDAMYVALAETLEIGLVTTDARLTRAPGMQCPVELVAI